MAILLYNRSCYSLLQSTIRVNDLIDFSIGNGLKAIGICEKENLFLLKSFSINVKKPILNQ